MKRAVDSWLARALVGALGLAAGRGLPALPSWSGRGSVLDLLVALGAGDVFWPTLLVATPLFALAGYSLARRGEVAVVRALAGPGLALAAILIDPWAFRSTATPLLLCGGAYLAVRLGALGVRRIQRPRRAIVALCFLVPALLSSARLIDWVPMNGDEPHYALIAHSLWFDGDLEVESNYAARDYETFRPPGTLEPHVMWIEKRQEARFSYHSPALAVWLAPIYGAAAGLAPMSIQAVLRLAMCLWAAALGLAVYSTVARLCGSRTAVLGTAAMMLTPPILFNAPHLFPDMPAAALAAAAYELVRRARGRGRWFAAAGTCIGVLYTLHFKFLGLIAALIGLALFEIATQRGSHRTPGWPLAAALLAGPVAAATLFAVYTALAFDSLSPLALAVLPGSFDAEVGAAARYLSDPLGTVTTAIGLLLDQKEGLLAFAPHALLAVVGAAWLVRRDRAELLRLTIVFASYWGPVALSQNVGLWSPPVRWLVAGLGPVAVLAAIGVAAPITTVGVRRVRGALLGVGAVGAALYLANPALAYVDRATRSPLLQHLGAPGFTPWRLFPVWFRYEQAQWVVSLAWLLAILAVGWWLWHRVRAADAVSESDRTQPSAPPRVLGRAGRRAVVGVVVVATLLAVVHRAGVPSPAREAVQIHDLGRLRLHRALFPPARVWPGTTAAWFGGRDTVLAVVSTARPIRRVTFRVRTAADMAVRVRLGGVVESVDVGAGTVVMVTLEPRAGMAWNGRVYYPLEVTSPGGAIASEGTSGSDDYRVLGANLELDSLRLTAATQ